MKKQVFNIAAVCTAVCCLGACTVEKQSSEYDALNEMLNATYSQVVITVTDTFDESASLNSEYIIHYQDSGIKVYYTVEKFAEIDDSLESLLSDMKTTLTGEMTIKSGSVVSVNGDDIGLTADMTKGGFSFKEEYFEDAQLSGVYLKADVKDASAFFGHGINCTDMKVQATFLDVFYDIQVTYTSEMGSKVEITYTFTR